MKTPDRSTVPRLAMGLAVSLLAGVALALTLSPRSAGPLAHTNLLPAGGTGGGTSGGSGGGSGGGTSSCIGECLTTVSSCGYGTYLNLGGAGTALITSDPHTDVVLCSAPPACPTDPNGIYSCSGTVSSPVSSCNYACVLTCNAGYNDCGGTCVANSTASCGASCSVCSAPANATANCVNGSCTATCNSGYHNCGGSTLSCVAVGVNSCTNSCTDCTTVAPSNSSATACAIGLPPLYRGYCACTCSAGYWPTSQSDCASLSCASQSFTTSY